MAKIVIVEDDEKLSQELEIFLIRNGYEAEGLRQFDHVLEQLQDIHPDLVLLDLNLPDTDGTYILKEFRKVSDVPVIMITSRDSDMDELLAMAEEKKISFKEEEYNRSLPLIQLQIKALIARDLFDMTEYFYIINDANRTYQEALKLINDEAKYNQILRITSEVNK